MNQILTFQLDRISLNAGVPENSGISRNVPIPEDFEAHGVLQFSLSNLPAQARANLSAILAEKQTFINKAIPGFTMKEDSILIVEENSFISSEKEAAYRQFLKKLLQTAHARKWVVPNRKNTSSGASEKYRFRIWLNQLGLKGAEHASTRQLLTGNLSGSSAYSSEEKMEAYNKRCLGYQKDQAGNLVPDKNAELVRQIFQMAADGWSISQITKYLNENKITTQNDRTFIRSTVSRILHNHAYKGDYICQRYYVNNQRKLVRNKGEKQMYYIRHDHPAIVSEEMWETAQEKLAKKSERNRQELPSDEIAVTKKAQVPDAPEKITLKETILQKQESGFIPDKPPLTFANYPYKDRIFCKYCGSRLRRIIARNHSVWWICNGLSRKGKAFCKGVRIPDEKLSPLRNVSFSAYIGKELIDGKETYGYSSKPDEWKR